MIVFLERIKGMKTTLRHIFTVVLALFFLVAGTGFNIVKYCCHICYEHGIEEVAKKSCGSFHHEDHSCCDSEKEHETNSHDDIACSNINHHPDGCHILRLNVETPTIVDDFVKKITVPVVDLFSSAIPTAELFNLADNSFSTDYLYPPNISPSGGREILSLKRVLNI